MLNAYIVLLCLTAAALLGLTAYILTKEKKKITYIFLAILVSGTICCLGYVFAIINDGIQNFGIRYSYIAFFGEFFAPVFFLMGGIIFAKGEIKWNFKNLVIFIIPILSNILLWTNEYHHLFFKAYNSFGDIIYGPYFYIVHLPMMYGCMIGGFYHYIKFSVKNSGFFSKQAMTIVLGMIIPFIFNMTWVMGNIVNNDALKFNLDYDILPITFSITVICYWFAILKLDFLNVIPIALQRVVDCISDSFIIINTKFELVDYNKSFIDKIMRGNELTRKEKIMSTLKNKGLMDEHEEKELVEVIKKSIAIGKTIRSERNIEKLDRIFNIEITPIFSENKCIGIIILFKDITELNKAQNILVEQERLASLGQLAGGMAHDINTPIATVRLGLKFFENRYPYTEQELKMLNAMKISSDNITEIVESVRNQIRNTGQTQNEEFTISKVFDSIKVLLNNELEKNKCALIINNKEEIHLNGDFSKLMQILMNIITNSIQAYENKGGNIDVRTYKNNNFATIEIEDKAGGISDKIASGIFKQILTTKGTKGTGFGLYFSQSMLRANFNGDISFKTEEGLGSIFYIKIPIEEEVK